MDRQAILQCKSFIEEDNLQALQGYIAWVLTTSKSLEYRLPLEYMYQQIYLHACLKKKIAIVEWLKTLFQEFGEVEQIAIRQMFSYGNYLLRK